MQFVNLAAEGKVNPLIPHTAELIVGAIAFTLLFLVLRKFVVPMFEKAFTARTEAIQGGIERAEKAQVEAQRALTQYTEQLSKAQSEAQTLREEARVQGAAIIEDLRAKAQEEAARIQQLLTLQSKQNVNRQLHHFVMKLVLWLLNLLQRLLEKHWMIKLVNHESLIVFLKI